MHTFVVENICMQLLQIFIIHDPVSILPNSNLVSLHNLFVFLQGQRVLKSQQTKVGKTLNQAKGLAKSELKNTSMTREGRAVKDLMKHALISCFDIGSLQGRLSKGPQLNERGGGIV
jgi:hypothetical protein